MPTFTPPTSNDVGLVAPATQQDPATRLGRHLAPIPRGRNVYLLTNGTFTEEQPVDDATVAKTYHGGHVHDITEAEAAALTAAGYAAYIA